MLTSLFASLLTVLYLFLSVKIILLRKNFKIALGESREIFLLTRYIRAQGNLNEYAPIFLILFFLLENSGTSWTVLSLIGLVFLMGRILHAYSLTTAETYDEQNRITALPKFRMGGMMMTFLTLIVCVILNLGHFLG